MQGDSESTLLKGLAEIQKEISKLRSDCKKLSKRTEQIEIQGLQDQVTNLHDTLLETRREIARLYILYHANIIMFAAENQELEEADHFIAQLRADSGHAQAKVETSQEPRIVAEEFIKRAYGEAEKLGVKFVVI
jgi:hypothetical protein